MKQRLRYALKWNPFVWKRVDISIAYCKENLDSDLEDVMQAMCALKHKFDYILTEDLSFTKSFIENKNLDEIQNIFKY